MAAAGAGEVGGAGVQDRGVSRWRVPMDAASGAAPSIHLGGRSRAGRVAGSPGGSLRLWVPSRPGGGRRRRCRGRARGLPGRVLGGAGSLTRAWAFIYYYLLQCGVFFLFICLFFSQEQLVLGKSRLISVSIPV